MLCTSAARRISRCSASWLVARIASPWRGLLLHFAAGSSTIKAIRFTNYGSPDVLRYVDVAKPQPADGQVLIKVRAASINAADWHIMRGDPWLVRLMTGVFKPKLKFQILGTDVAGVVEAVGAGVTKVKPGDAVMAELSGTGWGGFAEYVRTTEQAMGAKPANLTFAQAAAMPCSGQTALQAVRDHGKVEAGQRVLVHGATGGVGSFAVQIAKACGAEVAAVGSTSKLDMLRTLGADHVIDYTQEDCAKNGQRYDVILDAGAFRPMTDFRDSLTPTGRYIMVGGSTRSLLAMMLKGPLISRKGCKRFMTFLQTTNADDLAALKQLAEAGNLTPAIDRTYALRDVPDAIRAMEARDVRGKHVVDVDHCDET
jgi:NADPH:quinone reductase-like Zn-dependent oxidoreductase